MKDMLHWLINFAWVNYRMATASWRKLPEFIIIGTQKGGTTSLFNYLSQHPELSLSKAKEVHYFDNNFRYFSQEQFLIIKSENLFSTPDMVLQQVCSFLDIEQLPQVSFIPFNQGDYQALSAESYTIVYQYFLEDMKKLQALLGEEFSWPETINA